LAASKVLLRVSVRRRVAVGVEVVVLSIHWSQAVGGIAQVIGRIAVDDLLQPVAHRVVAVLISFAGVVIGPGQPVEIIIFVAGFDPFRVN
jgi:hypothetical protein